MDFTLPFQLIVTIARVTITNFVCPTVTQWHTDGALELMPPLATLPDQSITDCSTHHNPHYQPRGSESMKYQTRSRPKTMPNWDWVPMPITDKKKRSPPEVKSNHLQFTSFCGRRSLPRFCAASMLKWHNHYETNKKLTSGHLDELIHGTRNQKESKTDGEHT